MYNFRTLHYMVGRDIQTVSWSHKPTLFLKKKRQTTTAINFPAILYGYNMKYFMLRQEHKLQMFGNSVPRKMFGPK
jgi:hypothetical protein